MVALPPVTNKDSIPWIHWILSFADLWGFYVTFTFPYRRVDDKYAIRKTREIIRRLNVVVFGRRFREKKLGLLMICCIQDISVNPHMHLLIEDNPKLNEYVLARTWIASLGPRASCKAIDVRPIDDLVGLAVYVTRRVNKHKIETLPIPNIPPGYQNRSGRGR